MEDSSVGTEAFVSVDELYRLHAGDARKVARSITRNPDDAADAVAEAFTRVLEAVSRGRVAVQAFRPYLLAATRNAATDIVRRTGRLTPTEETGTLDGAADWAGPSERLLAGEDRALVADAFAELPPRWRAVLWLTEVESMAPREAATLLGLSPNNVAQLAVRARSRLRHRYVQLHVRNHAAGDCLEATEHLGGLVAGELTPIQANRVRGHLAECAQCRERLAELEDLGLTLRRAALPLPVVLHRFRRRWPWRRWRHRRTEVGDAAPWPTRVDPGTTAAITNLLSSPAVQQVAASVTAGLLVLGVGAAAVRHQDTPAPGPRSAELAGRAPAPEIVPAPPAPERAAEPATAPVEPVTTTSTTSAPTTSAPTTTVPPAPPAAPAPFTPRGPLATASLSVVAHAVVPELAIFDSPAGAARRALANPQPSGAPLVLLVTEQRTGWLQVLLPVRPNGSTGWIRAQDVTLVPHDFRIVVELGAHRITAYKGTDVLLSEPIGVGTRDAPTPGGLYYIKELFQPVDSAGNLNPNGPYGPYAYGLSGFSEVLFDFGGGDGQFGIHGTNDPSTLGTDVSHGCIRMSNAGITRLARTLPLGVPVEILR